MKVLLYAVLDKTPTTVDLLRNLSKNGYNGTVIDTVGLKHVLPKLTGSNAAVISLSDLVEDAPQSSIAMFVVIDEDKAEELKSEIREATKGFTLVKGGMFVLPIVSYEGSF